LPDNQIWAETLKQNVADSILVDNLTFYAGVTNHQAPKIYRSHEIFVNLSSSGMYDKTIFEAMACGCLVLVCNQNLIGEIDDRLIFEEDDFVDLAKKLRELLGLAPAEKRKLVSELQDYVARHHGLKLLVEKLITSLN